MHNFNSSQYFIGAALLATILAGCGGAAPNSSNGGYVSPPPYSSSSGATSVTPPYSNNPLTTPPTQGDLYSSVGTNPFVNVAHDPLSTFAVDVDTASYDIYRRDMKNYGRLPNPASVRLEEYVNFFDYKYPAPAQDAAHPFAIKLDAAPNVLDRSTKILRVGIQATKPLANERKKANLVFLVDVSGSMGSSDKLPLVQKLLGRALDILNPDDTVSIVTYASGTGVRLAPTPISSKEEIINTIVGLYAAGSTNGGAGIQLAYEQALRGYVEGGINHIILCTDGDFNVGVTSNQALIDLITEKRKTGVTFTALGFGAGNLNDSMMEATSNAGNGTYAVIASEAQAQKYVSERIISNITYVAKDMKIQMEFNPTLVSAYRLLGYENRNVADNDFRNDTVDAGEIGAGHRVTALYELVLKDEGIPVTPNAPAVVDGADYTGPTEINPEALVKVKVRYKHVDATENDAAFEVSKSLDKVADSLAAMDDDFRWAVAVAAYAEILKRSPYADNSLLDQLSTIFNAQKTRDGDHAEFVDLFNKARAEINP